MAAQRLKFGLWNFARQNPLLGSPVRALGRLSTRRSRETYRRKLQGAGPAVLPPDRYERPAAVSTQLWLAVTEDENAVRGATLLLNHLRVPYRKIARRELAARGRPDGIILFCGFDADEIAPFYASGQVVFSLTSDEASKLLPWNDGLLSPFAAGLIGRFFAACGDTWIVTGMLPPRLGFRLDDVEGRGLNDYLPAMLRRGWKPNLGLFMNGIAGAEAARRDLIAGLAREGAVEISPHAFAADDFIFFDFPRARPFSPREFARRWDAVKASFECWEMPISATLNAHFQAVSPDALPTLAADGVLWHYADIVPGKIGLAPSSAFLPSGDPTCTTGQIGGEVLQIYSGDPAVDCNQPGSLYDFLMHVDLDGPVAPFADRILRRVGLCLECGFPAFVTTHEYLLCRLSAKRHPELWDAVDAGLSAWPRAAVKKVTLSELGRICGDHTGTVIRSVSVRESGGFSVELSGSSSGCGFVTLWGRGKRRHFAIPPFSSPMTMEIAL